MVKNKLDVKWNTNSKFNKAVNAIYDIIPSSSYSARN